MAIGIPTVDSIELTQLDDPGSFRAEASYQGLCARCHRAGPFDAHHVVERRHCRRLSIPTHSPDNALRLCSGTPDSCHERHTGRQDPIPLAILRDENIAFAIHHLGAGPAYEYLTRYYVGRDARVDALLDLP